jgi:hypothetical protein
MSSSTSSSDWRRFFRLAAGTAALLVVVIYAFVVLVDPFNTLPLSPPADRVQVASNARFAFPSLARSQQFDSAVFGTSTARLLRPVVLNPEFGGHFANLAMNDSTVYEQSRLFGVFVRAHPAPRSVIFGLDVRYCATGDTYQMLTPRPFPEWMYGGSRWRGYAEMLNLYAVQEAGQLFGIMIGIKQPTFGRDGYTSFVPPDSQYDPARVAMHLREGGPDIPPGERSGAPSTWRFPALEQLRADLVLLPDETRRILFFVPYNHVLLPPSGSPAAIAWNECKRRVAMLATEMPNTLAIDFMRPGPITNVDDNYWDALHYRVAIADRIAHDLAAADHGETSPDYRLLTPDGPESALR